MRRYVQYASPVYTPPADDKSPVTPCTLPLPVLANIVGHLTDPADLARITRTSRLLYYMALPSLYKHVSLRSYPEIRYVNGQPEGFGGGSPFLMALNGLLATQTNGPLVEELRIWGQWKDSSVNDFSKGRVPDDTMMLNTVLRGATDKMTKLQHFSWSLDCKPLKTLYQGLATHTTLTRLTLKCPDSRIPRPSVVIPPIPNLRAFFFTDIDPVCYPDDISMLLLLSTRLEDLRLHFSPRMRREAEPTLSFQTYFGRCLKAGYRLRLKHFAFHNFFAPSLEPLETIFDIDTWRTCCIFDAFGGVNTESTNVYVDESWKKTPAEVVPDLRSIRCNELSSQQVDILGRFSGLEKIYFVNSKASPFTKPSPASCSPYSSTDSPTSELDRTPLGKDYVHVLTRHHGSTLKHLLLSDVWNLSPKELGDLIRWCPNLEQLGVALVTHSKEILQLLLPFLPNLKALRLLPNIWLTEHMKRNQIIADLDVVSRDLYLANESRTLRWIGLGDEIFFHMTGRDLEACKPDGTIEMRREILLREMKDVQHVEIWGLDNTDIGADPIAPFSP